MGTVLMFCGAAGAAFAPTDIAGLQIWLDADTLVPTFGWGDGADVSVWLDSSNHPNSLNRARQWKAGHNPMLKTDIIGTHDVVRFEGGDNAEFDGMFMDHTGSGWAGWNDIAITQGFTAFAVSNPNNNSPIIADEGGMLHPIRPGPSTSLMRTYRHATVLQTTGFDGFRIMATSQSDIGPSATNDAKIYLDGLVAAEATQTNTTFVHWHKLSLGTGALFSWGNWFDGDIGEILMYNTVLSEAHRDAVGMYLGDKYNLAWVPEPASAVLLLAVTPWLLRRRRNA